MKFIRKVGYKFVVCVVLALGTLNLQAALCGENEHQDGAVTTRAPLVGPYVNQDALPSAARKEELKTSCSCTQLATGARPSHNEKDAPKNVVDDWLDTMEL